MSATNWNLLSKHQAELAWPGVVCKDPASQMAWRMSGMNRMCLARDRHMSGTSWDDLDEGQLELVYVRYPSARVFPGFPCNVVVYAITYQGAGVHAQVRVPG